MERKRSDTIPRYEPEALRQNIVTCGKNIERMQKAIDEELEHITYLKELLAETEKQ